MSAQGRVVTSLDQPAHITVQHIGVEDAFQFPNLGRIDFLRGLKTSEMFLGQLFAGRDAGEYAENDLEDFTEGRVPVRAEGYGPTRRSRPTVSRAGGVSGPR